MKEKRKEIGHGPFPYYRLLNVAQAQAAVGEGQI